MRTILLASIAAVAVTSAASAQATESSFNISGGYTALDGEGSTLGAATLRAGFDFGNNIGIEAEGHFGVGEEDLGGGADFGVDYGFIGYGLYRFPVDANGSNVFLRAGYGQLGFEVTSPFGDASEDINGFALGLGGEWMLTERFGIRGDYTRFEADDDFIEGGLDTYAISGVVKF